MIDQAFLNNYYATKWDRDPCSHPMKSGSLLLDKITEAESVLDVGCGRNPFKGKIKNLMGFDPAFDQADVKCTIDEFVTDQLFDVALCLGSINVGAVEDIERHISRVVTWLKPQARIYWRCNPGLPDGDINRADIPFYKWTFEEHERLSQKFGFELVECTWDPPILNTRIYAEWRRR
jgi:hypothetical protein